MAISSNKSPSHQRTTEEGVRKSFKGNPLLRPSKNFNPITPANSPADLRRSKEGIPNLLRSSYEFKENDKDQKRVKETKGTKSFMAPTISAISKISPSPRKKVLSERNETVRSSISESAEFSKMCGDLLEVEEEADQLKSEMGFDSQVISEPKDRSFKPRIIEFHEVETNSVALVSESEPLRVSQSKLVSSPNVNHKPSSPLDSNPKVTQFEFKANNLNSNNSNSKTKKPFSSPSTSLAPLDSDPHVPPYDPKTNFTSPRPQFLHFKPRPRIEVLLEKEKGVSSGEGKRLEDSFSSESCCSDTENSEVSLPSDSLKESESDCSSEDDELLVSESDHTQSLKPKSLSGRRFRVFPFLLVVAIACLFFPVTDTPVYSPSLYKDHTFKLEGTGFIVEYAKANLDEIASNLKVWSTKTISYLSALIPGMVEEKGSIYFSNVTVFNQEPLVYDEYVFKKFGTTGENDGIVEFEMGEEVHEVESQTQTEEVVHAVVMETNVPEIVEPEELDSYSNSEPIGVEVTPPSSNLDYSPIQDVEVDLTGQNAELDSSAPTQTSEQGSFTPSQSAEVDVLPQAYAPTPQCLVPDVIPQHSEINVLPQSPKLDTSDVVLQDSEVDTLADSASLVTLESATDFAVHYYVGGIMAAVLAMVATSVYFYVKPSKTKTPVGEFVQKKMVDESEAQEKFSSQPTEVEMTVGESGPAMSSSCKRSLYDQKGLEKMNETQSQEKRLRYSRESLASSSSEYSYGSFTTYEKIHAKHGYGEEEVVTPVRRSSRIRQITSPST